MNTKLKLNVLASIILVAFDGFLLMVCAFGIAFLIAAPFLFDNAEIGAAIWGSK